jgi:hypothetical protein
MEHVIITYKDPDLYDDGENSLHYDRIVIERDGDTYIISGFNGTSDIPTDQLYLNKSEIIQFVHMKE